MAKIQLCFVTVPYLQYIFCQHSGDEQVKGTFIFSIEFTYKFPPHSVNNSIFQHFWHQRHINQILRGCVFNLSQTFFPEKKKSLLSWSCNVAAEMFHKYEFLFVPYQASQPDSIWSSKEKIFTQSYFWRLLEASGHFHKTAVSW